MKGKKEAGRGSARLPTRILVVEDDEEVRSHTLESLSDPGYRTVSAGVRRLVGRFDWDGVNLAELYFESLEGIANASRFTPMNADVRAEFRGAHGFDPVELFSSRQDAVAHGLVQPCRLAVGLGQQALERLLDGRGPPG